MKRPPYFKIYQDEAGEWRWRLVAANNRIIADSGEGYKKEQTARDAVVRLQVLLRERKHCVETK